MKLEKITQRSQSRDNPSRRRYEDACGTALALDLLGERWAMLVVRELMLGPRRFSDLRAALPGLSANTLTQRLEGLEQSGILLRRQLPPPASSWVYELTPWGYESEPIFQTMGRWAARSPEHDATLPLSPVSIILSFRTMFDANAAAGLDLRIGLKLRGEDFFVRIAKSRLSAGSGGIENADATLTGTAEGVAAMIYGGAPAAAVGIAITGDRTAVKAMARCFTLPDKVAG